jgi:hypothetical protein
MGSIFKRKRKLKNGTVGERPTYWIKYYQNNLPIRESTGSTSLAVAKRMLRTREGDVEKGIPINPKTGRITFDEGAEVLLNEYKINERKTLQNAAYRIKAHLAPHFGGRRLASISTADIRKFVAARLEDTIRTRKARTRRQRDGSWLELPEQRKAVSAGEINRELATLKRIFTLAQKAGDIYHVPAIELLT